MDEAIRSPRHASKYSDDVRAGVALSLLAAFDFQSKGIVTKDEWDRGTKLLGLQQEDSSVWERLHQTYGDAEGHEGGERHGGDETAAEDGALAHSRILMFLQFESVM